MSDPEEVAIPENYVYDGLLSVFNFAIILPVALTSMRFAAELWDFIFILIGVYCTKKCINYISKAHEYKQTRMMPENMDKFVKEGIYADVRHPVAAGMLYMNIAYIFLFRSITLVTVVPAFFALWFVLCKHKERILIERFGDDYRTYIRSVGMFRGKGDQGQTRLSGTGYDV